MEEVKEELIEELNEDTPVYVIEDSIQDILVLKDIQDEIDKKELEKKKKEEEITLAEENKRKKADEISTINTGDKIEEVTYNLRILREQNAELEKLKNELEEIYADLRSLEEDKASLEDTARKMVEESTKRYLTLVEQHVRKVDEYIISGKESDSIEIEELANEIAKFKEYKSFSDIIKGNSKEEVKEEVKEEPKVEEKVELSEDLNEVKVDEIEVKEPEIKVEEPEVKEPEVNTVENEVKEEVKAETPVESNEEVKTLSIDDLLNSVSKPVTEPVIEKPIDNAMPEQPIENTIINDEVKKAIADVLVDKKASKIAASTNKGVEETRNAFNSQIKVVNNPQAKEIDDKKLTLAA